LQPFCASISLQRERRLIASIKLLETLACMRQPVPCLTVGVPRKPVLPASAPMRWGDSRIQIQTIAMLEANVAFVDHLHVGSAAGKYASTDDSCELWDS
jgi:hypothetical protein